MQSLIYTKKLTECQALLKMPKENNKRTPKDKEEEKKSKYGLSKETLERILESKPQRKEIKVIEESDSIISEEELNMISKLKNKKDKEEEKSNPIQREIVLERELSDVPLSIDTKRKENNSQDSEYISKNKKEEESNAKYQNYETNSSVKLHKAGKISESWTKPFQKREIDFVSSNPEMLTNQKPKYESYFTPKNLSDEEMKGLSKRGEFEKFQFKEKKMHYYNN